MASSPFWHAAARRGGGWLKPPLQARSVERCQTDYLRRCQSIGYYIYEMRGSTLHLGWLISRILDVDLLLAHCLALWGDNVTCFSQDIQ